MRFAIVIFTIIFSFSLAAQEKCNYSSIQELEKDLNKIKKKRSRGGIELGEISYQIAECYRLNNDTNQFRHYKDCIEYLKKSHPDKRELKRSISMIAYCYYYVGKYEHSEVWFSKSIKANYDLPNAYFYRGKSLYFLEDYSGALQMFETYLNEHEKFQEADSLMKDCARRIK